MGRHRTAAEKAALKEQVAALRLAGVGARRIARERGIGQALCRELLAGVPPPASLGRPNAKDEHREAALALRREGRTYDEIRLELGVSKGTLSLWLREVPAGVEVGAAPDEAPRDAEVARQLREDGWLLREIAEELGVSVKTAHVWTRGMPVPARATHGRSPEDTRAMNRARWDVLLAEREAERQAVMAEAASRVGCLSPRELELVAVTAYWCEGTKSKPWRRDERVTFINSDEGLICLWLALLAARGVPPERLRFTVNIHESADLNRAAAYWQDVVGCSATQFTKPVIKRHNPLTVRKNVGDAYRGCLTVRVLDGRLLHQQLTGAWRGIAAQLRPPAPPTA